MKTFSFLTLLLLPFLGSSQIDYTMPGEDAEHLGTWIAWPHDNTYGAGNRQFSQKVWIDMTVELTQGEMVYILAYDSDELTHIESKLEENGVDMSMVELYIVQTDDYWMRDNGPIFALDSDGLMHMIDWDFNGWGDDAPYLLDNLVPTEIETLTGMSRVGVSDMVLEGGSLEIDGTGAVLLCRSSVTNANRNPDLTETEVEERLTQFLGLDHFLWLDGTPGLEITDGHIDGFAKFVGPETILTLDSLDLLEWGQSTNDIETLYSFQTQAGDDYNYVVLPLTANNVSDFWGSPLGYKGSYVNYYVANESVLVPFYNDTNDNVALAIVQDLYPDKNCVGIDVTRIYEYGGMIHCITQQQPLADAATGITDQRQAQKLIAYPNPAHGVIQLSQYVSVKMYNSQGVLVFSGKTSSINVEDLPAGMYTVVSKGSSIKVVVD